MQDHVVDIIALRSVSSQDYMICCSQKSAPFIIVSSHKKSTNKPVTTVTKGKRSRQLTKARVTNEGVENETSLLSHLGAQPSSVVVSSSNGYMSRRKPVPPNYSSLHEKEANYFEPMDGKYESSSSSGDQQQRRGIPSTTSNSRKRSHSSSVGEVEDVAQALMSLVRPASYFFDIKKSMAQQQEQQLLQLEEEQRQEHLRRATFQYASDSSASDESGDEQDKSSYSRRNAVTVVRPPPVVSSSRTYEDLSQDYIILPTR